MNRDQFKQEIDDLQGHYITPDQLCIGLYVHLDLGWMQHPFAFSNFKIKDADQLRKIHALDLKQIRYDPERSDVEPRFSKTIPTVPAPGPEEPQAPAPASAPTESLAAKGSIDRVVRLKQLNRAILETEASFFKHGTTVREVVRNLSHQPEHSRKIAEGLINDWVNSVITESDVALHAICNSRSGHEGYVHPMNVTVLALMLAKSLDMKEEEASMVGMAAMFHDVGKEESLRNKSFMDMHCAIGASIAERAGLSERISRIILEHHECVDGSGFPMRLKEDRIDPLARLLALVNHYDNLCNPLNPADAMTPYEALSVMFATQQHKFDTTMLRAFVRALGVYPPGSVVQLSNDMYGSVVATNQTTPMLPLVMVHVPKVARETPVVINLSEEKRISIRKCMRPEHLPKPVFDYLKPRKCVSYYFLNTADALLSQASPHQESGSTTATGDRLRQA